MRYFFIFLISLLSGCLSIEQSASLRLSQRIDESSSVSYYPEAVSQIRNLVMHPPMVDLSYYKSAQNRPHQRSDIAIAIAASGGGYRSANLTAGVLTGLEKITHPKLKGTLLQEVDYFSTTSGGGFGVGLYFSSFYRHMLEYGSSSKMPPFSFNEVVNNLIQSHQENMLRKDYRERLFFNDARSMEFEENLDNTILSIPGRSLLLGDIFIAKGNSTAPVTLPYWVTNATIYQNAALFPFTPDVLAHYHVSEYQHHFKAYPINAHSMADAYTVPVSVGLAASASFPIALTAIPLKSDACSDASCYLQLVDGGVADNLAAYSALDLLRQDPAKTKILIIIDAYRGFKQPFSQRPEPPTNLTLFWRVFEYTVDASHQYFKSGAQALSRDILCGSGAKNVIVIYLDLDHYPEAWSIGSNLYISREQQLLLLKIGKELVAHNYTLNVLLKQFLEGNHQIGSCSARRTKKEYGVPWVN